MTIPNPCLTLLTPILLDFVMCTSVLAGRAPYCIRSSNIYRAQCCAFAAMHKRYPSALEPTAPIFFSGLTCMQQPRVVEWMEPVPVAFLCSPVAQGLLDCYWRSEQCEIALIPLGATGVMGHGPGLTTNIEQAWICFCPSGHHSSLGGPAYILAVGSSPSAGLGGRSSTATTCQMP